MAGSAIRAMVSFFTVWPTDMTQEDMDAMDSEFHLAPVVGAMIGVFVMVEAAILMILQDHGIVGSGMFMAAVILLSVYVGSRFLHFDGLADFGDGSIVAGPQERHVKALKDTLIGAGGLGVALTVTLLNFSEYAMAGWLLVLLAPVTEVMVKNAQVAAAAYGEPSNGMAGRQVSETTAASLRRSCLISLVLGMALCAVGMFVYDLIAPFSLSDSSSDYVWITVLAVLLGLLASVLVGRAMARRANRVFGFVNGDILGATHEISRAVVMIVMIAVVNLVI